ncbi:type II secretion system F family protein [Curtobacterium flaccumfaciens pv. flaccumfaciens]|uniref:type II secretion system F family protein n=1 Tax=Curtobacterium flaccumfaciens TaxID=2035 RepID=UPI001BCD2213|nr:type II secretion system F family protein [Curtobacterium flaccumfaciens]QVG65027.1 type II secretion system F family protein [Curtobacterium flaccumfaciens pv. flaccumfaciens]
MRRPTPDGPARVAGVLDRVATLVAAGVPPPRAWRLVGGLPGAGGPAQQDIVVVLRVADRTGAPVAETLRGLAGALRRAAASDRAIRVALAGPRTSARVVLALPLFGLGLGAAWGAGAVEVLVGSPAGWACSCTAAALVLAGRRWTARLVRSATPDGRVPGVLLDAWAVAVAGGGSWSTAGQAVAEASAGAAPPAGDVHRLREVLDLARRAGVPAAGLLRRAAEDVRDEAAADGLVAAERLAVRLVLPLGVCILPAFVLVGVVPVVVGVLSSTVGGAA